MQKTKKKIIHFCPLPSVRTSDRGPARVSDSVGGGTRRSVPSRDSQSFLWVIFSMSLWVFFWDIYSGQILISSVNVNQNHHTHKKNSQKSSQSIIAILQTNQNHH